MAIAEHLYKGRKHLRDIWIYGSVMLQEILETTCGVYFPLHTLHTSSNKNHKLISMELGIYFFIQLPLLQIPCPWMLPPITQTFFLKVTFVTLNTNHFRYVVRFQVFTAASMKMTVFWDIALIALTTETVSNSESTVNSYETTRRNIPEDCHLHLDTSVTSIPNST
jgi:hypothetical protein